MVSKLAKQTIEKWQSQGLKPTVEDVVKLNALGLKIERCSSSYEFGTVPRVAFLGDSILTEPTVAKRIWLEQAMTIVADDFMSQMYLTAFALNCPSSELPLLNDVKKLTKAVADFRDNVLLNFTITQILAAIDYALSGAQPEVGEEVEVDGKKKQVDELPETVMTQSRQLLMEALAYGLDEKIQYDLTLPQLEKVVTLAAINSGVDVLKGEHAKAVGKFYVAAGQINKRL